MKLVTISTHVGHAVFTIHQRLGLCSKKKIKEMQRREREREKVSE